MHHPSLILIVAAMGFASPAPAQICEWALETAPNPAGTLTLFGLDAADTGELWTVGSRIVLTSPGVDRFNYAARWNGSAWIETPVPQPSTLRNSQNLQDVVSIGANFAIAVGAHRPAVGASQSVAVRWDGDEWSLMDAPFVNGGSTFEAIGRAGADVWTVGGKFSELPPPAASGYPLAAKLEGGEWTVHFVPPRATVGSQSKNTLRGIEGASANDAWAVGFAEQSGADDPFGPAAMAAHWNGSTWTQVDLFPLLDSTDFSGLEDLAAIATDDVWAVGYDYDLTRQLTIPLILHWDGSAWTKAAVPTFDFSAELRAVAARGPDDVYAAGTQPDANGIPHALMLHYDGSSWSAIPQKQIGDFETWFRALTFQGETLWASGQANTVSDGFTQRTMSCNPACAADLASDGQLDFSDVAAFLTAFASADPIADFNVDGSFDFSDVSAFLTAFGAGCP